MKKKIKAAFIINSTKDAERIVCGVAIPLQANKWRIHPALAPRKPRGFYRRLFNLFVKTYQAVYDLNKTGEWAECLVGERGERLISRPEELGYNSVAEYIRQTKWKQSGQRISSRFKKVPVEIKKLMYENFVGYGGKAKRIRLRVKPESISCEFWQVNKFEQKIKNKKADFTELSLCTAPIEITLTKADRIEIAFSDDPRLLGELAATVHAYDCLKNPRLAWIEKYKRSLYDESAFRYFIEIRGEHDTASKGPEIEENDRPLTLAEMIAKYHRLIFVGPSGSGKTTTLKHYAYLVGQEERFKERNRPIGIYVNLADFDLAIEITNSLRLSTEQALIILPKNWAHN